MGLHRKATCTIAAPTSSFLLDWIISVRPRDPRISCRLRVSFSHSSQIDNRLASSVPTGALVGKLGTISPLC
ncbi:hypothetical protein CGCF415_v004517 [Colletotrichum fructicola]|uniref:Uncharacterized protein n=1 Tax=Colletotrichum fructicola (strain Nara gc5) TaxID=1213859 RepID=A0A7J6ICA8_COLFN|nr:hypothetical protein CGGC5_v016511 [Colletotrichum fructicola Nara gc5]KAF4898796.1 hypothetical protein CGCFRS4_v004295 [Colletotrichum fructicola]KAF4911296.1 hypothetical protein CGCF415_v004517 [Colletotrichum fructicola]KAF4929693.1 hypothetical protein CGCF245_v012073 [Colletotrichum fructicola]KAF5493387.1 hypothetical protein CGCF413_v010632 [Colletotrichum fructicola]